MIKMEDLDLVEGNGLEWYRGLVEYCVLNSPLTLVLLTSDVDTSRRNRAGLILGC